MRRRKLLALGLLSAMAVTTVAGINVFAAESNGGSQVVYTPGQSTGQNPDGSLADWTVDYPVKVVLNDANVSKGTGMKMTFSLVDTDDPTNTNGYTGTSTVNLRVKNHNDIFSSNFRGRLQMRDSEDYLHANVLMVIGLETRYNLNDNIQFKSNGSDDYSEAFAALNSTTKTCVGYAYLYDKTGAVDGESYHQTVTWNFSNN